MGGAGGRGVGVVSEGFVAPPRLELPGLSVRVLGPVEVAGWAQPPSRAVLVDILVYLACHPGRACSTGRIASALGLGSETDPENATVRSNMSRLRKAVGADRLPDGRNGYTLRDVHCDWTVMADLARRGDAAAAKGDTGTAISCLVDAVSLIGGSPFDVDSGYGWVDDEGLRAHIEGLYASTAARLAGLATNAGRPELALWAVYQGSVADPFRDELSVAALRAAKDISPGRLSYEWDRIQRRHKAKGVDVSGQLAATWARLNT